jgi:hypothetical protein
VRAVAAAVAALAGTVLPVSPHATATLAPSTAGAHTMLTLAVRARLQCGAGPSGPVVVSLPPQLGVPRRIDPRSTRIDDRIPVSVAVSLHAVTLKLELDRSLACDATAVGTVDVVFLRSAGLVNPRRAGVYPISVRVEGTTAATRLIIFPR